MTLVSFFLLQVATDKVAGKLSSTLSWVKNTVSQMASQVASPSASLHTTSSSTTFSTPALSPSSPGELSPDELELLAKLEEQNRWVSGNLIWHYTDINVFWTGHCKWLLCSWKWGLGRTVDIPQSPFEKLNQLHIQKVDLTTSIMTQVITLIRWKS